MIGDVSRGLKQLRTEHQNRADSIAALEAIQELGGIERAASEAERQAEAAKGRLETIVQEEARARANLTALEGTSRNLIREIEINKDRAQEDAAEALRQARAKRDEILDAARSTAAETRSTAEERAARIVAEAEAKAAGIVKETEEAQASLADLQQRIIDEEARLAAVQDRINATKADLARM